MSAIRLEAIIEVARRSWEHKTGLNKVVLNSGIIRYEPFRLGFLAADKVKEQLFIATSIRKLLSTPPGTAEQLFFFSLILQTMTETDLIKELFKNLGE